MKSKYAPSERERKDVILGQKKKIESADFLDKVLAGTPLMFFILNNKRQIVYSNHLLMKHLGYEEMDSLVGMRPGEIFGCVNSELEEGGCGTSENCRYCGAVNAVLESSKKQELVVKDSIINGVMEGLEIPMNFEVSSRPFVWQNEDFFVVTLQSNAEKKRKEQLERTFFHDITNKTGNVKMFLDLIEKKYLPEGENEMFKIVKHGLNELLEDISYQKKLQQAENGELALDYEIVDATLLMKNVIDEYTSLAKAYQVKLACSPRDMELLFKTDKVLIKRILGNLIKNAIEASNANDLIELSCIKEEYEIIFRVSNPVFMPVNIQAQLFNRSFSTKGPGRGIGTYSIKLFSEQYLKGEVDFVSDENTGTVFNVRLPFMIK